MVRARLLCLLFIILTTGCAAPPVEVNDGSMFAAESMRIHPIFTRMKDWTGDGQIDGIEALLEFQDAFGDPTKATGKVIFELFEYRPDEPDAKGVRVVNPWIGSLSNVQDQRVRWNRTSRTYGFQLALDQALTHRAYVLTATFERANAGEGGASVGRFFDRLILEPRKQEPLQRVAPPTTNFAAPSRSPEP